MRKLYYLLCMVCTLCAFNACSDDDDDTNASVPVTEITVPAKVQAGGELIIAGNGFAKDCKIMLKNESETIELTITERLSASITCSVPKTLAPGEYTVVLLQAGEWPLRKITVLEEGAPDPNMPVTSLLLPKDPVAPGAEVVIQGIGFANNCEIWLQKGEERQKMTITATNTDVKFTLPGNFAADVYTVILIQDGKEWTLGEITVEAQAVVERNQIDKIAIKWSRKGKDHEELHSYTYDELGRVSQIEVTYDGEKSNRVVFTWTAGGVKVENYTVDTYGTGDYRTDPDDTWDYTVDAAGKVTQSDYSSPFADSHSYIWEYFPEGYLKVVEKDYKYTMDGNHIQGYTNGMFSYKIVYDVEQPNKCVVDLMGEVLFYCNIEGKEQYYARIAGITGSIPDLLPSSVISLGETPEEDFETATMEYETYPDGYVSKITFDDERVYEITYK